MTIDAASAMDAGLTVHRPFALRRSGRKHDISRPCAAMEVRRMNVSQKPCIALPGVPLWEIPADQRSAVVRAREHAAARKRQKAWNTTHGRVELSDGTKSYIGTCQECRKTFTVERSAASSRKWPSVCDGCQDHRRRKLTAARVRKHREMRKELDM